MIRLLLIIGFIILCYAFPSSHEAEYLTSAILKENTARSLYLCVAIALIWPCRSAFAVVSIEILLVICNFYTRYHLEGGAGFIGAHYSLIQKSAFWIELLIMFTFMVIEWRKSGEDLRFNLHRSMSNRSRPRGDVH